MSGPARTRTAQAWIELKTEDPAAVSALSVARARLAAGAKLLRVRRFRVIELQGALPGKQALEARLHASSWFYNPHKESCTLRTSDGDPAGAKGETILVVERGASRAPAAERWWRHATRRKITVREGVAWVLDFAPGTDPAESARALMTAVDRTTGLFSNPHAQTAIHANGTVPLAWIVDAEKETP
jgi:hypothetical protein